VGQFVDRGLLSLRSGIFSLHDNKFNGQSKSWIISFMDSLVNRSTIDSNLGSAWQHH
jgi:hypothetical protein